MARLGIMFSSCTEARVMSMLGHLHRTMPNVERLVKLQVIRKSMCLRTVKRHPGGSGFTFLVKLCKLEGERLK